MSTFTKRRKERRVADAKRMAGARAFFDDWESHLRQIAIVLMLRVLVRRAAKLSSDGSGE